MITFCERWFEPRFTNLDATRKFFVILLAEPYAGNSQEKDDFVRRLAEKARELQFEVIVIE